MTNERKIIELYLEGKSYREIAENPEAEATKSTVGRVIKLYKEGKIVLAGTEGTDDGTPEKIKDLEDELGELVTKSMKTNKEYRENKRKKTTDLEKLLKLLPEPSQILDFMENCDRFPKTAYHLLNGRCKYLLTYTMEAVRLMVKGDSQ